MTALAGAPVHASAAKSAGAKAAGSLIAPWQGTHGWYWQNKSEAPVVVRLRTAGFYELIPNQPGATAVKE